MNHKHKGVERKDGTYRPHPIERVHRDKKVQMYHNLSLGRQKRKKVATTKTKKHITVKRKPVKTMKLHSVNFEVKDDWVMIDFDTLKQKGIRIMSSQIKGSNKRTVGMEIPKNIKLY